MKVYLLNQEVDYEPSVLLGIFISKELATAKAKELAEEDKDGKWKYCASLNCWEDRFGTSMEISEVEVIE